MSERREDSHEARHHARRKPGRYALDDVDAAREAMRAHLRAWEPSGRHSHFAWPDDHFCAEWWAYHVHVGWVGAWNRERRETPVIDFVLAWLDGPGFAEAWREAVEWETRADTSKPSWNAPRQLSAATE